ncbi:MAG: pyrrolo-quinoline quinone [Planctomycetota bacterium]|nr:MAG: pyrrolo-quinoline quinone [Planctomycetota bacterium]
MAYSRAPGAGARCSFWIPALLATASLIFASTVIAGPRWPQWRGPHGNGVSEEKNPPVKWSRTENVLWRMPLPGPAGSTPVVWDDRIFLTSVAENGDDLLLICATTKGDELWRRVVSSGNEPVRTDEGTYASPSPTTDGKHVWTFMANGFLACYDFDGERVWAKDLQEEYGKFDIQFGMSSTPVLDGDRLFIQLIHGTWNKVPSEAHIVCLDKTTGKELWDHLRRTSATDECKHAYTSPIIYRDDERAFLVTHGADYAIAHRLTDGEEIWRFNLHPKSNYEETLRFVASPAAGEGIIVLPTAKNRQVVAIRPDGEGDISDDARYVVWATPNRTPDVPSPLIRDGLVYLCRERGGILMCFDAETGERYYMERTVDSRYRASPVYADGKIYMTARKGVVSVVKAGREFEVLATNDIGETMTASPVIVGGRIYLRSFEALYAIGPQ